jgi:UDP-glucuronate 4-epimerase
MKVLVTGCYGYRRGFIANRFADLYDKQYSVEGIDRYEHDIRDGAFEDKYDMVVHLAAMAGVRRSHEEPELYWDVNVKASQRLFKFYEDKCPVIYASSSSIYEWWLSPYASTKWTMECIAPPNTLGLRFHTVYGPNSRVDMLYDMLQKRNVSYLTNHTRDWTHVDDICSAIDICINRFHDLKKHVAIDVGNGRPVSVVDMAEKVWPNNGLPVKEVTGERDDTCADPTILLEHGWIPKHHILEG